MLDPQSLQVNEPPQSDAIVHASPATRAVHAALLAVGFFKKSQCGVFQKKTTVHARQFCKSLKIPLQYSSSAQPCRALSV